MAKVRSRCLGQFDAVPVDDQLPSSPEFSRDDEVGPRVDEQRSVDDRSDVLGLTFTQDEFVSASAVLAVQEVEPWRGPTPPKVRPRNEPPERVG